MRTSARVGAVLSAAAALCLSLFLMAAPAVAAPHLTVQSQVQHYLECLNWLYTDQAKHREFCEPGHDFWFDDNTVHQAPHGNYPLPVPPGVTPTPPPTDNCPPKDRPHPVAYVGSYGAALLPVTIGGDCPPPPGGGCEPTPSAYVLTGMHGCPPPGGGGCEPHSMPGSYQLTGFMLTGGCDFPHPWHPCEGGSMGAAFYGNDVDGYALLVGGRPHMPPPPPRGGDCGAQTGSYGSPLEWNDSLAI